MLVRSDSSGRSAIALLVVWLILTNSGRAADSPVDFTRDIRPILSDRCFACHGPDDSGRAAELRLDVRDDAIRPRDGHRVIAPGQPGASELVRRILSSDPDEQMPPPAFKKPLSDAQKQLLTQWIQEGAAYRQHWSFQPPRRSPVPTVTDPHWSRHPIDAFLYQRMQAAGLNPSPEADALTLIRRLWLDLTGLPPTPEEADHWVLKLQSGTTADARSSSINETAWGELVDHLLALPQYGERHARRWLDLARYADTNGYEKDRPRSIWPYRDWVIQALNDDMPFDRFTIEQLAGDMLPEATREQLIATGFHRNTMLNEEGGIDPLEFRFHAMTDRVATTGAVWLGLTLQCCQCHNHKYDPVAQRDYYQLMAFLNNADEPELDLPSTDASALAERNRTEAARLLAELPKHWPLESATGNADENQTQRDRYIDECFEQWLNIARRDTVTWQSLRPMTAISNLPLLTIESDDSILATGDTTKFDTYDITFGPVPQTITALRLEALPDDRLPAHGPGTTYYEGTPGDFFLTELKLTANDQPVTFRRASQSYAKNRFGSNEVSARLTIDGDFLTGWSVDGRLGERHTAVYVLDQPLTGARGLHLRLHFGRHFSSSLGRFRVSFTTHPDGAEARDLPPDIEPLLNLPDQALTGEQRQRLRSEFLMQAPELEKHAQPIRALRKPVTHLTTLVMRERPENNPRPTFIHKRGEYLQPLERVEPGTPEVLHPFPSDRPRNRLEFARWLVSPDNPLTARVVVNREWALFFGRGLVKTVEDFGVQGEVPTHPELLDWLAVEFMQPQPAGDSSTPRPWSLKQLHRLIVTSAAWRQSSQVTPDYLQRDPDNRWLVRAPRFRREGEVIRDATLKAAGLLSLKAGGPPVKPPQPDGVTETAYGSPRWEASPGDDRHRRSVYTFQKRTAPFALFNTFDAPSGEACVVRRDVSNTALQALTVLNDVTFLEAASALGTELSSLKSSDADRLQLAFRRILTRPPTEQEQTALQRFLDQQRARAKPQATPPEVKTD